MPSCPPRSVNPLSRDAGSVVARRLSEGTVRAGAVAFAAGVCRASVRTGRVAAKAAPAHRAAAISAAATGMRNLGSMLASSVFSSRRAAGTGR